MTVTMLLHNTIEAQKLQYKAPPLPPPLDTVNTIYGGVLR
jgi:hypothetical protein